MQSRILRSRRDVYGILKLLSMLAFSQDDPRVTSAFTPIDTECWASYVRFRRDLDTLLSHLRVAPNLAQLREAGDRAATAYFNALSSTVEREKTWATFYSEVYQVLASVAGVNVTHLAALVECPRGAQLLRELIRLLRDDYVWGERADEVNGLWRSLSNAVKYVIP